MKKTLSNISLFVIGFIVCATAMKALYGFEPSALLSGSDAHAKQVVLTTLAGRAAPAPRFAGDSVVADAAAKLEPAIVDVHTVGKAIPQAPNPFMNDPMFRQFFGGGSPDESGGGSVQPRGAGSGVIISPDGYILTNDHVIKNTAEVTVKVGEKGYTAKVIGTDPETDLAVLKIDPKGAKLPVAELGDSDNIRIGDWALAIGNPLDIGTTVTLGIISAKNRTGLTAEGQPLKARIQTDAAINPGNSGGALANINGQVIGINEAIYSPTGSYVGIGFAIPINSAKTIAAELIKDGKIVRPYLGVRFASLKGFPQKARQQMGVTVEGDNGAIITEVSPGSPAEAAGLRPYDVILDANRVKVTDSDSLYNIIQGLKVGDTLALRVSRDGAVQIMVVTLKDRPANFGETPQTQQQQSPQMEPFSQP